MGNVIVIGIILLIVIFALRSSFKHFKGEGGCCGGGSSESGKKKKLEGSKLGEYVIKVDGMHCENCRICVENAINRIDGVSAKVSLKKKQAVVSYDRKIEKEDIYSAIRKTGYGVG